MDFKATGPKMEEISLLFIETGSMGKKAGGERPKEVRTQYEGNGGSGKSKSTQ